MRPFLTRKLLADQLSGDSQGRSRMLRQCLSTTQPGVRWANRPGCKEHLAIALQHYEGRVLIGQPAESGERNHSIVADDHQSAEPVSHAGQTHLIAVSANSVLDNQVTAIHAGRSRPHRKNQELLAAILQRLSATTNWPRTSGSIQRR